MSELEHETESRDCWCLPEIMQPCPECVKKLAALCWRCQGRGLVEAFDLDAPCVIVHKVR